jgi:phenylpropionate dioxygenase-like ring-hydroxylating dioxygenase large terminal subunit
VGDYKTTFVGEAPVIVVRTMDGGINAVLNRCQHKGALLCYKPRGNIREFTCVYHNWVYDLDGKLTGVAFRKGVGGKGGVDADFNAGEHNLVRLRVDTYKGLIFGTFSPDTPVFRDYLGAELLASIDRVFIKPLKVLGYHSQVLPNNWKLYAENNKDSYHASLLHVFHNTFGVVRPNMGGGVKLSDNGWHHLSYTVRTPPNDDATGREKVRSLKEQYSLNDVSMMEHRLELGDFVTNSIQTVFPTLVVQQILNALAVRQLVPRGVDRSELLWTVLGFADDTQDMIDLRLKANNLVGPAGFISMEDGCVGGFVQRAAKADPDAQTIMPMGGKAIEPSEGSRVTEAAVRGFWKGWRECMKI